MTLQDDLDLLPPSNHEVDKMFEESKQWSTQRRVQARHRERDRRIFLPARLFVYGLVLAMLVLVVFAIFGGPR